MSLGFVQGESGGILPKENMRHESLSRNLNTMNMRCNQRKPWGALQ